MIIQFIENFIRKSINTPLGKGECLASQDRGILTILFYFVVAFFFSSAAYSHPAFDVKNGLKALESGDLDKAESLLQKARFEEPDSFIVNYDLGIISYRKRDYGKSIRFFARASELSNTTEERFDAFYNMGNSAFKGYDFALAVNAYKNALAVKNDYQAEYNLKVAEKKLQEQLDRQKKEQEQQNQQNQQNQQGQDKKDQQNQQGQQGQDKQDLQNQQGQQGQDNQDQQNQQAQSQENDSKSDSDKQKQEQQSANSDEQQNKEGEDNKQTSSDSQKESEEQKNKQEQASKSDENKNDAENRDNKALTNEETAAPEEDRREVKMTEDKGKVSRPEASQRARAMKNIRLNKDEVEAYLKKMEQRENEYQQYYRINNIEDKDPATLNQEELKEWLRVRNRKKEKMRNNEQDW